MSKIPFVLFTVALALSVGVANAQINAVDGVSGIDVSTDPGTTLSSVSGSGTLTGVSCKVTTAPSGSPAWGITIAVDGASPQAIQGGAYFFSTVWAPTNFIGVGNGSAVGDIFYIPLHFPFSTSLVVRTLPVYHGSGGVLTCNVYRN